jgi:thiol-disulfide isomerase/thioredoxin
MSLFVLIARFVLVAVFVLSGVAKLIDRDGSRTSLRDFAVPEVLVPAFVWLLPAAELACAALLVVPAAAWWGAVGAAALLAVFTLGISVSLLRGRKPACHCFGQLSSEPVGASTLVRNLALLAVATLIVSQPEVVAASGLNAAVGGDSLVAFLAFVVVAQTLLGATLFFYVLRQNGRMLLRMEALEAKLGIAEAPEPLNTGLPIGTPAPEVGVKALPGKPQLFVFSETECAACEALRPEVEQWQNEHTAVLQVVLLEDERTLADAYGVVGTPSAVLVRNGKVASQLAAGAEAIRALVKQAIVPPPLQRGERVPSIPLRALDEGTTDLATLTGARTLLLFWNPSCGYCQSLLDDVRAWERERPVGAPQMVVVSAGSPKANREQQFRSRVLLDPKFDVSERFGVPGTPAAVLLDPQGRVASEPKVGGPAVLALMGADARVSASV